MQQNKNNNININLVRNEAINHPKPPTQINIREKKERETKQKIRFHFFLCTSEINFSALKIDGENPFLNFSFNGISSILFSYSIHPQNIAWKNRAHKTLCKYLIFHFKQLLQLFYGMEKINFNSFLNGKLLRMEKIIRESRNFI